MHFPTYKPIVINTVIKYFLTILDGETIWVYYEHDFMHDE